MTAPAISVSHLTKRFGDRAVVDDVSLTVATGEIAGFLGPNGSGKTTTIRLICGLLTPDEGTGTVLGHDLRRDALTIKREVGYMTQRFSFYEDLTIAENLQFVAGLYRLSPARKAVADTLADLGLSSRKDQLAGSLSGGWKQRLALAACIMHRPKLLMLDEPTAGVDPKARREFWDEIHGLAAAGMTVLVSTHYMDEAERCHELVYIAYGKVLARGTERDIVQGAGLHVAEITGTLSAAQDAALRAAPGVQSVAAFGTSLHVTATDPAALQAALVPLRNQSGLHVRPANANLEDVFISLIGRAKDNYGNG